jgi:hypothetical protein
MRAIFVQISGLVGILSVLNHLWNYASMERTVFVSLGIGFSVYFVLSLGESMIRHILAAAAAPSNTEDANVKSETLNTEGGKASSPRPAQA